MSDSRTLRERVMDVLNRHRVHIERSPGVGPECQQYGLAVLDDVESDLLPVIEEWERDARARVLCALGSPTPEDMEQIERLLREREEGRR